MKNETQNFLIYAYLIHYSQCILITFGFCDNVIGFYIFINIISSEKVIVLAYRLILSPLFLPYVAAFLDRKLKIIYCFIEEVMVKMNETAGRE